VGSPSPRLACTLLLAAALAGCGRPQLAAHWRDRELVVDGKLDDWAGWQSELREAGARVAVANDAAALYVALETTDPTLARLIAHRGLTVWLDPTGGEAHTLGLRFPLPAVGAPSRWGEIGGSRPGGAQLDKLELLGPQPYTRRELPAPGADGVQVALGGGPGVITYEARVPLAGSAGWGLGAAVGPGSSLGIGLQARGSRRGPPRRGPGAGRGPGEPGGRPPGDEPGGDEGDGPPDDGRPPVDRGPGVGGGPGTGRGFRPGVIRDFEAWAVVRLASGPGR
jgi:hypothetical protein